jgi:hypothetical protein
VRDDDFGATPAVVCPKSRNSDSRPTLDGAFLTRALSVGRTNVEELTARCLAECYSFTTAPHSRGLRFVACRENNQWCPSRSSAAY